MPWVLGELGVIDVAYYNVEVGVLGVVEVIDLSAFPESELLTELVYVATLDKYDVRIGQILLRTDIVPLTA